MRILEHMSAQPSLILQRGMEMLVGLGLRTGGPVSGLYTMASGARAANLVANCPTRVLAL